MIYYVDASAWGKLLIAEPESAALRGFADGALRAGHRIIAAELLTTELLRLAARVGADPALAIAALTPVILTLPDRETFRLAGLLPGNVRSLDALHVAAALQAGADVFVSYDSRQLAAARAASLDTHSPHDLA